METMAYHIVIYFAVYLAVTALLYLLVPVVAGALLTRILRASYNEFLKDSREKLRDQLRVSSEKLISAPHLNVVGGLVKPHIETLCRLVIDKVDEHAKDYVIASCRCKCLVSVYRYRFLIALTAAQFLMALLCLGYLLHGVI